MNEQHYTFAQFWKCALQVNSNAYSGTYRGEDHGMDASTYAETLRDVCLREGIEVVGLADHGNVSDAEIVRKILVDADIVVFPGFEVVTTGEGSLGLSIPRGHHRTTARAISGQSPTH